MTPGNPSPLNVPTPAPAPDPEDPEDESEPMSITEINLDDSAEINAANLQALIARAKRAGKQAVKKTRMAFDTTKALADSGLLKLPPRTGRHKKRTGSSG